MNLTMRTLLPPLPKHHSIHSKMFQVLITGLYDEQDNLKYTAVIRPTRPLDDSEPMLVVTVYTLDGNKTITRMSPASKLTEDGAIQREVLVLADLCIKTLEHDAEQAT